MKTVEPGALLAHEQRLTSLAVPMPSGQVHEDILVPARGFMRARKLAAGQSMRIVQVDGQQCADLILFDAEDLRHRCSMVPTILEAGRWQLRAGDRVMSSRGVPMALIAEDTLSAYQTCGNACSAALNQMRYGIEGTHSCQMNLVGSMSEYDFRPSDIGEGVFGAFFNMVYSDDGSVVIEPLENGTHDYVDLKAEMDLVVALSACPQERNPANNWEPKALRIIIHSS